MGDFFFVMSITPMILMLWAIVIAGIITVYKSSKEK
jgi:hypothetical protein